MRDVTLAAALDLSLAFALVGRKRDIHLIKLESILLARCVSRHDPIAI